LNALRKGPSDGPKFKFRNIKIGAKGVIFIAMDGEKQITPSSFASRMFKDLQSKNRPHSRVCARLYPVEWTSQATVANIDTIVKEKIVPLFEELAGEVSFWVSIKIRNNNGIEEKKDDILMTVLKTMPAQHQPVLSRDNPDWTIFIQVVKTIACVGCVEGSFHLNFNQLGK